VTVASQNFHSIERAARCAFASVLGDFDLLVADAISIAAVWPRHALESPDGSQARAANHQRFTGRTASG